VLHLQFSDSATYVGGPSDESSFVMFTSELSIIGNSFTLENVEKYNNKFTVWWK
jgi:hypothetical protein